MGLEQVLFCRYPIADMEQTEEANRENKQRGQAEEANRGSKQRERAERANREKIERKSERRIKKGAL